jgi:hypothetical protein
MPGMPVQRDILGYDAYGRPIFKPISPYDEKPKTPAQTPEEHALDHTMSLSAGVD